MTLARGGFLMTSKISLLAAIALAAIVAVPSASYAASKKSKSDEQSQSVQRNGPNTKSDFQAGGGRYYKRSKTKKHHSHSPANG
jgi:Ni/Co efflux regulator RcnB